jgi:hypothetical protein
LFSFELPALMPSAASMETIWPSIFGMHRLDEKGFTNKYIAIGEIEAAASGWRATAGGRAKLLPGKMGGAATWRATAECGARASSRPGEAEAGAEHRRPAQIDACDVTPCAAAASASKPACC